MMITNLVDGTLFVIFAGLGFAIGGLFLWNMMQQLYGSSLRYVTRRHKWGTNLEQAKLKHPEIMSWNGKVSMYRLHRYLNQPLFQTTKSQQRR